MRFGVKTFGPSEPMELSEREFEELCFVKKGLATALAIEEKFDLLRENYEELEDIVNQRGDAYIPVTPLTREYLRGLGRVHERLRELMASDLTHWDDALQSILIRAGGESKGSPSAVVLVTISDDDRCEQGEHLFTGLVDRRKSLERRNVAPLALTAYATGATTTVP